MDGPPGRRRPHSSDFKSMDHLSTRKFVTAKAWALLAVAAIAAGCGRGGKQAGAGGPPTMPVEVVTLAERPVEETTEFVGTVKSRRSTTVQPQVEGFVTHILVRSGDRVRPGSPLMDIDAGMQQAAVANLESQRAARQADVQYARQQAARMKRLLEAGAASEAEMEQAQTALSTSEAQLKAAEAQTREQRVALAYHRVTAPVAGVVGDIPVRVGDSVTRSTVLTTIDQNAGLEVYVNVPVQEAAKLRVGLPVQLVDDRGQLLTTTRLSFVATSVDTGTQSVLAKAVLEAPGPFRTEQFVRARIVWTTAPALTVPLVALNRVNGQFFAYVAEPGDGGTTVARQLKAGEKLIVSGVQKIRDGAPVTVGPPSPAAASGKGR